LLLGAETQNLLAREFGQLMVEGVYLIGALLGGGFGRCIHASPCY
jgi:hypothetical protein